MIRTELPASKRCCARSMSVSLCFSYVCVNRDLVSHMAVCVCLYYPEQQSPQGGLLLKSCNE